MNFRQDDEDPFVQAYPAPDPTQPPDSAWRDVVICAGAIAALFVLSLVSTALRAPR